MTFTEDTTGHFIIYCAICIVNGKKYIGHTSHGLQGRKKWHEWAAGRNQPGDNSIFHRALRCYGFDKFCWKEIASTNSEIEAVELENCYIEEYTSYTPHGYNIERPRIGRRQGELPGTK